MERQTRHTPQTRRLTTDELALSTPAPMPHWVLIAELQQCPPGTGLEVVAEGRMIALFNVDGRFYALDGICPHQGGPLGKGELKGTVVTCPWHGWQFDVCSGKHVTSPLRHPCLPIRVEQGRVYVDLEGG